jgi:hypothetical protein
MSEKSLLVKYASFVMSMSKLITWIGKDFPGLTEHINGLILGIR